LSHSGVTALQIENIEDFYGHTFPADSAPKFTRDIFKKHIGLAAKGETSTIEYFFEIDGNVIWFRTTLSPFWDADGNLIYITADSMDITDRIKSEMLLRDANNRLEVRVEERTKKLRETNENLNAEILERKLSEESLKTNEKVLRKYSNELEISNKKVEVSRIRLRELNKKLQTVREEEKLHLARDIHDELGQVITYCKLELQWIIREIKTPEEKIDKKLVSMVSHLDNTLASVRRISSELRPQILGLLGISEAIKWQAKKFKDQTLIEYELNIFPNVIECERDMSVDLFRIFQEILTNISRHAEADLVQIFFEEEKDYYRLIVKDNGKGFNETSTSDLKTFGILGIRERAFSWDGSVNIESQPESGTTITVKIPNYTQASSIN
jgi:signal transduction histidine kinase